MVRAVGGAKIHSNWSASAGQLVFTRDNASVGITWGEDGSGIDNTWFGDTSGAYMKWDESANTLTGAGGAILSWDGAVTLTGSAANIGNTSADKLGFFGQTAVVQQAKVASGAASAMAESIATVLVAYGLTASV